MSIGSSQSTEACLNTVLGVLTTGIEKDLPDQYMLLRDPYRVMMLTSVSFTVGLAIEQRCCGGNGWPSDSVMRGKRAELGRNRIASIIRVRSNRDNKSSIARGRAAKQYVFESMDRNMSQEKKAR